MGDRLDTIDTGRKLWAVPPLQGGGELGRHVTQCGLGRGLPSYQVEPWSTQRFGHNRHRPKIGGCAPFWGELGPHLAQCGLGRGLPLYQAASWSMQLFGHSRHGAKNWGLCSFGKGRAVSPSDTMLLGSRPTSLPSGILIHPAIWPQQMWAENWRLWPFGGGELGPYQRPGIPAWQVSSWSVQVPTVWPQQHSNVTDRQTGQDKSDSIGEQF